MFQALSFVKLYPGFKMNFNELWSLMTVRDCFREGLLLNH
ncbi:Uncharacterised protein [Moraxella ovis]|nr:Uncharacterised protein [Moraxella ovis]